MYQSEVGAKRTGLEAKLQRRGVRKGQTLVTRKNNDGTGPAVEGVQEWAAGPGSQL